MVIVIDTNAYQDGYSVLSMHSDPTARLPLGRLGSGWVGQVVVVVCVCVCVWGGGVMVRIQQWNRC